MSERNWPTVAIDPTGGHALRLPHFRIVCSKCGDVDHIRRSSGDSSDHPNVATRFRRAGWSVGGRETSDLCPNCSGLKPEKHHKALPMVKTPVAPVQPVPALTPTPAASAKITEVYMALEDAYDRAASDYRPAWSDERIARELGVAVELVAKRRAADFGPVKADTFASDLSKALIGLGGEIAEMRRFSESLGLTITALEKRHAGLTDLARKAATK